MNELMRELWYYARDCRMSGCYDREAMQGREQCIRAVDGNREQLEKICIPEISRRIEALCDNYEELHDRDMEAAFLCGFRLGMDLR